MSTWRPRSRVAEIDVEVGFTVIEVKKDLRSAAVVKRPRSSSPDTWPAVAQQTGQRYVGILTDGADWRAYHLKGDELVEATRFELKPARPTLTPLLIWLEGVLAVRTGVPPTPHEIVTRLGATSASHALDRAALAALYDEHHATPTVQLKRQLWSRLLRSALGTQFTDTDELFLEHTLLVNSAEVIAHLVARAGRHRHAASHPPGRAALRTGADLRRRRGRLLRLGPRGPGGDFLRSHPGPPRRPVRLDECRADVLKVLYESVIGAETRKRLGEYYTPDWLADQIVATR